MHKNKKQQIRKLIGRYRQLLFLHDYRVYTRFKTASEDPDLKNAYAVVKIDESNKRLYIKFNSYEFNRMNLRTVKHFVLHELVHVFFGELGWIFIETLNKAEKLGLSERTARAIERNFDVVEHKKLNRLMRILMKLDRLYEKQGL